MAAHQPLAITSFERASQVSFIEPHPINVRQWRTRSTDNSGWRVARYYEGAAIDAAISDPIGNVVAGPSRRGELGAFFFADHLRLDDRLTG